ncbi:MAG TPA: DUF2599 domain-containing protein [Cellulomonas sp.]
MPTVPGTAPSAAGGATGTGRLPRDTAWVRANGQEVVAGPVLLHVVGPDGATAAITASSLDDDAVRVDVPLPATEATALPDAVALAAPEGTTFTLLADDTAVLRDAAGQFLAGLTDPVLDQIDAGERSPTVEPAITADGAVLTWSLQATGRAEDGGTAPVPAGTLTLTVAPTAVRSATWAVRDDEGGQSLAVVPSTWARTGGLAADEGLWTQLVTQVPEAGTQAMHDQLTCHTIGAPDKESWNLEPWRPDVGLLATLAARCNPAP